jgi:crotonobetainyl-CoA:carnitine CoA-transferase CaiB-like acyl-CoA transferase
VKLSQTPGRVGAPAPALGEHTSQVLADLLEIDPGTVAQLAADGIVFGGGPVARTV